MLKITLDYNEQEYEKSCNIEGPFSRKNLSFDNFSSEPLSKALRNHIDWVSSKHGEPNWKIVLYSLNKTNGHCLYCNKLIYVKGSNGNYKKAKGVSTQLDHIYPANRGGILDVGNGALVCSSCNSKKSDKDPLEFMESMIRRGANSRYKSIDEFEEFFDDFITPYKIKWEDFYEINISKEPIDREYLIRYKLAPLLNFNEYGLSLSFSNKNQEFFSDLHSEKNPLWSNLNSDPKKYRYKLSYIDKKLCELLGENYIITQASKEELSKAFTEISNSENDSNARSLTNNTLKILSELLELDWEYEDYRFIKAPLEAGVNKEIFELLREHNTYNNSKFINIDYTSINSSISAVPKFYKCITKKIGLMTPLEEVGYGELRKVFYEVRVESTNDSEKPIFSRLGKLLGELLGFYWDYKEEKQERLISDGPNKELFVKLMDVNTYVKTTRLSLGELEIKKTISSVPRFAERLTRNLYREESLEELDKDRLSSILYELRTSANTENEKTVFVRLGKLLGELLGFYWDYMEEKKKRSLELIAS